MKSRQRPRLKDGQTAPEFEVVDMAGQRLRLSELEGQKVLLCFFRYAGCPFCNLAVHRLSLAAPQLSKLGLKVIAFIESEPENIQRYILKRHTPTPPFSIVADPQRKIYDAYGIYDSVRQTAATSMARAPSWLAATLRKGFPQGKIDGSASLVPAHFLVGPYDLTIHKASYGADYLDDAPMIEILDFAQFGPHI